MYTCCSPQCMYLIDLVFGVDRRKKTLSVSEMGFTNLFCHQSNFSNGQYLIDKQDT